MASHLAPLPVSTHAVCYTQFRRECDCTSRLFYFPPRRRALTGHRVSAYLPDLTRAEPFGRHRRNLASLDLHHESKNAECGTRVETGR